MVFFQYIFPWTVSYVAGGLPPYSSWSSVCYRASSSSPIASPCNVLTRGRQQIFLSTAVDFLGERAPSLTISVHKNGQLFQNRFPRKRIILHQNKFEKIYLKYLPSWRITKPINISKIWPLICMTMEKNFCSKY